ncbi:DNA cytosine methyltransferase [Streptomyces sp. DvalAA-14]|uniref:DNA cytosine methyltransferase n=2 Tax=unclassified Streptomyces TaxID=2593676 RepID=UPI000B18066A|nr:DNA cytosine methyltransferase [Streptomyces sp. DvalAA-14]MYS22061.1 DNA cytosine methyltransferase [Streptomyces sp. SID4948]
MSGLRIGSLCTGYGGLDMAVQAVIGGSLAWVADNDPGAAAILAHHHPGVPNLGDITALDWRDVPPVDVLCGGYPCQPFSVAGKRRGTADERHIWPFIATALGVLRPQLAVFENVANHLRIGFDQVLRDLARIGFDAEWCLVRASDVGAAHQRRRLIILAVAADAADLGHQWGGPARAGGSGLAHHRGPAADPPRDGRHEGSGHPHPGHGAPGEGGQGEPRGVGAEPTDWGPFAPAVRRWEHVTGRPAPGATDALGRLSPILVEWLMGLPEGHVTAVPGLSRAQQLKALGNGVVPRQAEAAIRVLTTRAGLVLDEPAPARRAAA